MVTACPSVQDDTLSRVLGAQRAALEALQSAAGDQSLCTLSRERVNAAKYYEGQVTALGDAARAVRSGAPLPRPEDWGDIAVVRAETDPRWRSYLVGGRDALTSLA
jgi:hypothetical protein